MSSPSVSDTLSSTSLPPDLMLRFRRFGVLTIVAVYLLIMVGGIVRATGSGMGCPDWPLCFGKAIPPTSIDELPTDYKTRFAVKGKEIADFNPIHTWTEYINRLIGVVIGLLILGVFILSLKYWNFDRTITILSLLGLLLVMFQGWLGAVVVANDLLPITISIHMIFALLIVLLLIYVITRSQFGKSSAIQSSSALNKGSNHKAIEFPSGIGVVLIIGIILMFVQLVLGVKVRQSVDILNKVYQGANRGSWLEEIGLMFYIHRSFSLLVFGIHAFFAWKMRVFLGIQLSSETPYIMLIRRWVNVLITLLALEILTGALMAYFAIPAVFQPIHLTVSALVFGVQFILLMILYRHRWFGITKYAESVIHTA
jgi:heme a synthase